MFRMSSVFQYKDYLLGGFFNCHPLPVQYLNEKWTASRPEDLVEEDFHGTAVLVGLLFHFGTGQGGGAVKKSPFINVILGTLW